MSGRAPRGCGDGGGVVAAGAQHSVSSLSRTWKRCRGPRACHALASVCGSPWRSAAVSRTQSLRVNVVSHSSDPSGTIRSSAATIAGRPRSAQCPASSRYTVSPSATRATITAGSSVR